jgi:predicted nucleic acid-binding protein
VKLIVDEDESDALRAFLADYPRRFASRIASIEVGRAVRRVDEAVGAQTSEAFTRLELIELTAAIAERATGLKPARLRTLDAIHLASAAAVSDEIEAFVTYDARLGDAAWALGLIVAAPGP